MQHRKRPDGHRALCACSPGYPKNVHALACMNPCWGGGRAANAAFDPMKLITKLLSGMRNTTDAETQSEGHVDPQLGRAMQPVALCHGAPTSTIAHINDDSLASDNKRQTTQLGMGDGTEREQSHTTNTFAATTETSKQLRSFPDLGSMLPSTRNSSTTTSVPELECLCSKLSRTRVVS